MPEFYFFAPPSEVEGLLGLQNCEFIQQIREIN